MNAAKITRQSKSNLALAFVSLGRERRQDITIFYAFCRLIDNIADDVNLISEEKRRRLAKWHGWLPSSFGNASLFFSVASSPVGSWLPGSVFFVSVKPIALIGRAGSDIRPVATA